jgi:hypothetical protein
MQNSCKTDTFNSIGIYLDGKLVDSIGLGFVYDMKNGDTAELPSGDIVEYIEDMRHGISYLKLVEGLKKSSDFKLGSDEEEPGSDEDEPYNDEDDQKMDDLEKNWKNDPYDPDMWYSFARYCENCEGYPFKPGSVCGCKTKVEDVLARNVVPLSPPNSCGDSSNSCDDSSNPPSQKKCPFGKKCHFLNSDKGCRNFHPESDKLVPATPSSSVSSRSNKPKRCRNGPDCSSMKEGTCEFYHPTEEVPCKFGERCNRGEKCHFRH